MRLAHLTDPHLSSLAGVRPGALRGKRLLGYLSWWRHRRHALRADVLDALTAHLRRDAPDAVMVTGDLVHIGLPQEYAPARAWLESLGEHMQVVLVPGNHDCYRADSVPAMQAAWEPWLGATDGAFPTLVRVDEVSLIGVSSACPTAPFSARGAIGSAQLERLVALLAESAGTFRCVGVHHPPAPGMAKSRKALVDAAAFARVLEAAHVNLVLHGHLHRNRAARLGDVRVYATAPASSAAAPERASYRLFDVTRAGNGWAVAARLRMLGEDGVIGTVHEEQWQVA